MDDNEIIIPDPAETIRGVVKDLGPKPEAPKVTDDELWSNFVNYTEYQKALKPYLEDRIARISSMSEIDFNGKESAQEIGIRYLICSAVAKELQDIITKIEVTNKILKEQKKEKEDAAKTV